MEEKQKVIEKEQEDLLVLLDEVTTKRKRDKTRLKEAGLEVSEDEGEEDAEEEDDEKEEEWLDCNLSSLLCVSAFISLGPLLRI